MLRTFVTPSLPSIRPSMLRIFHRALVLLFVMSIGWAGCSSPNPTTRTGDSSSAEAASALSLLYTTSAGALTLHEGPADTTRTLAENASSRGIRALSPSEQHLAFSFETRDSTHLAILDLGAHSVQRVDARAASVTYSLSWHPDQDRLAFAYYEPASSGRRGPGDVFTVSPGGDPRNVGCSAAREVLTWLPSGSLVTRNDEKLYVVAPSDCATRDAADAERMHEAQYAPGETHLAYLHVELTYNDDAHEYTPDSSLSLSRDNGRNSESLFGSDRRPRHLRWSPNGDELAFSVQVEEYNRRQISIYSVASGRTVYLTPPQETSGTQTHPRWSPSGARVAYTLANGPSTVAAVRTKGHTRRIAPVDGAVWGWLSDRQLVVPGPDTLRIEAIGGSTSYRQPVPKTLLHVWKPAAV